VHHTPWLEELDDSLERYLDVDPDAVEPTRSIAGRSRDDDREALAAV
jgi:trimethylamine monooxygenase